MSVVRCNDSFKILVHYNTNWEYHDEKEETGDFGPHTITVIRYQGIYHKTFNLVNYDSTNESLPYSYNTEACLPFLGKNFNFVISRIIAYFNYKERSYDVFYAIHIQIGEIFKDLVVVDEIVVYTFSLMLDIRHVRRFVRSSLENQNIPIENK